MLKELGEIKLLKFTEKYRDLEGGFKIADNQVECIDFLLARRNAICSPGTGYGKTLISCTAVKIMLEACKCRAMAVIVCPVKAVKVFKKELFTKLGYKREDVGIITTNEVGYDLNNNQILIVSNTNVEKSLEVFEEISDRKIKFILLVDEAHLLQETSSKIYQNLCVVREMSSAVWGITATPILNDLDSLYNIVNFVCPGFLGDKKAFDARYLVRHLETIYLKGGRKRKTWTVDGYQRLDELNERLKSIMIVRQLKYNLKIGSKKVKLSDGEMKVYEKVSAGIFGDEERSFSRRMHDLQRLVDSSYNDDGIKNLVDDVGVSVSSKESMFLDVIESTLGQGYSVIVYVDYIDSVNRLESVLKKNKKSLGFDKIYKITGQVSLEDRERVEDLIGNKDIIIITSAGSESINLQKANCIIFYDIPYSVKTSIQVIGRICRRDTKHAYQYVIMLYTEGTIDEYKYLIFQDNLKMVKASVGIAEDLPLEMLEVDKAGMKKLRDKLLWVYKSKSTSEIRKRKKVIRSRLFTSNSENWRDIACTHNFVIEPICVDGASVVKGLCPEKSLYDRFINDEVPYTVLRAKYLEILRSEEGKKKIDKIAEKIYNDMCVINLIGNTELNKVLYEEIISSVG